MDQEDKELKEELKAYPELMRLSDDELAAVVSLLAHTNENALEVKNLFREITDNGGGGKNISLKSINYIRKIYADKIKERKEAIARDIFNIPLANETYQLKQISLVLKDAKRKKHRGWEKSGEKTWDAKVGKDPDMILKAVLAANKITQNVRNNALEKEKIELRRTLAANVPKAALTQNGEIPPAVQEDDDAISW